MTKRTHNKHTWTTEQDTFLLQWHGILPNAVLTQIIGVDIKQAKYRWEKHLSPNIPWSDEELRKTKDDPTIIEFLKNNINNMTWQEMSYITGKTERVLNGIAQRNHIAKIHEENPDVMSKEETLQFLKTHIDHMSWKQMSEATGRKKQNLEKLAQRNNIKKQQKRAWRTLDENGINKAIAFLKTNIDLMTWDEMEEASKISKNILCHLARKHGIRKTKKPKKP